MAIKPKLEPNSESEAAPCNSASQDEEKVDNQPRRERSSLRLRLRISRALVAERLRNDKDKNETDTYLVIEDEGNKEIAYNNRMGNESDKTSNGGSVNEIVSQVNAFVDVISKGGSVTISVPEAAAMHMAPEVCEALAERWTEDLAQAKSGVLSGTEASPSASKRKRWTERDKVQFSAEFIAQHYADLIAAGNGTINLTDVRREDPSLVKQFLREERRREQGGPDAPPAPSFKYTSREELVKRAYQERYGEEGDKIHDTVRRDITERIRKLRLGRSGRTQQR
jgi:hypothetical protein